MAFFRAPFRISWLLIGLGWLTWQSCGGPRRVILVNQTGGSTTAVWGLRPERSVARPYASAKVDTLYTFMDDEGKARKTGLVFGEGKWNVNEIDRVADRLTFIEVVREGEVIYRVQGKDTIRQLLRDHVKGLNKRVVEIEVP